MVPQKVKLFWVELPYDSAIPFLGIHLEEMKIGTQVLVCECSLHFGNYPSVSIHEQMNKMCCVCACSCTYTHTHTQEYYCHKKEQSSDICYNMNEPWKYYFEQSKPDTNE